MIERSDQSDESVSMDPIAQLEEEEARAIDSDNDDDEPLKHTDTVGGDPFQESEDSPVGLLSSHRQRIIAAQIRDSECEALDFELLDVTGLQSQSLYENSSESLQQLPSNSVIVHGNPNGRGDNLNEMAEKVRTLVSYHFVISLSLSHLSLCLSLCVVRSVITIKFLRR